MFRNNFHEMTTRDINVFCLFKSSVVIPPTIFWRPPCRHIVSEDLLHGCVYHLPTSDPTRTYCPQVRYSSRPTVSRCNNDAAAAQHAVVDTTKVIYDPVGSSRRITIVWLFKKKKK